MAIRKFTYPLKGNNDVASIRTKELALEAFLNSLNLSTDPDDPLHDHDSSYAPIAHSHPPDGHSHDQYMVAVEGEDAPLGPDIGDVWIEDNFGVVQEVWIFTSNGWVALMGGGGGGGSGPHNRHPNNVVLYDTVSNVDQWKIAINTSLYSLDFEFVG
jgi:hypothetical protein